ncbi:IBR domain, Zinc finger, RING/FYVE/PHD-type, E3 ubiquitin ligase RBR family [Heracleum sosnowskyi]|uniref:RBR-type E3 ubiquitin transferase n=1 Tax=Heracleum sosnowskyi TaxID=360622 RepID=A0AAD8I8F8_9APIA|nr:IBR domain, Zinc finger, RING/FYVE/PHD-type, E3 ubiquitin ligase RBR family [Heracleum sosnowskyi]
MGNSQKKLEVNMANFEQVNPKNTEQVATESGSSEAFTCEICNFEQVNPENTEQVATESGRSEAFTCEICIEPMSSAKKFRVNDNCMHPFCNDCFAKYIQGKVEDSVAIIKCPALDCELLLDPLLCRTIISVELFTKWCDCLCDSSLLLYERCYCPYQDCSALIINECGGSVSKTKCLNCKRLFCYTCEVPWHAGYWCSESQQRRDASDVSFGELVEKFKWTRCPHCGQAVERRDGCRMVTCRCRTIFCHKCGKEYHFGPCDKPGSIASGYWCFEFRQGNYANDVRFEELVEKFKWTRCPNCGHLQ